MSIADLQDKLTNSNLGNWFILRINDSYISWTRGRYSSDIDYALVNSSTLDKISSDLLIFLLYLIINLSWFIARKLLQMDHFYYKKNLFGGIGINALNLRKKFLITINLRSKVKNLGNVETFN